jgi:hypothetical protein
LCVCVCVCVRVRVRMRACVRVCIHVRESAWDLRGCVRAHAHAAPVRFCRRLWRLRQQFHAEKTAASKGALYSILDGKCGPRVGSDEPEAEVVTIFGSAFLSAVEERAARDL